MAPDAIVTVPRATAAATAIIVLRVELLLASPTAFAEIWFQARAAIRQNDTA
jgi:hypothetical protein